MGGGERESRLWWGGHRDSGALWFDRLITGSIFSPPLWFLRAQLQGSTRDNCRRFVLAPCMGASRQMVRGERVSGCRPQVCLRYSFLSRQSDVFALWDKLQNRKLRGCFLPVALSVPIHPSRRSECRTTSTIVRFRLLARSWSRSTSSRSRTPCGTGASSTFTSRYR